MAGIVAFCYLFLWKQGTQPSLEKASRLASEVGYNAQKGFVHLKTRDQVIEEFAMNAEVAGVKKIFREYRSVCHVWMAELSIVDIDSDDNSLYMQTSRYAQKTATFQNCLSQAADTTSWDMMDLGSVFGTKNLACDNFEWGAAPTGLMKEAFDELTDRGVF
jgi:hypothetical protein